MRQLKLFPSYLLQFCNKNVCINEESIKKKKEKRSEDFNFFTSSLLNISQNCFLYKKDSKCFMDHLYDFSSTGIHPYLYVVLFTFIMFLFRNRRNNRQWNTTSSVPVKMVLLI